MHRTRTSVTTRALRWMMAGVAGAVAQRLPAEPVEKGEEAITQAGDEQGVSVQKPARRTLLREGSLVIQAVGQVVKDAERNAWVFTPQGSGAGNGGEAGRGGERVMEALGKDNLRTTQLILLPNSVLSEIADVVEHGGEGAGAMRFEITGEVYVYRQRNYLLAVSAPRLALNAEGGEARGGEGATGEESREGSGTEEAASEPATQSEEEEAGLELERPMGESVDVIKRQLDEAVGAVPTRAKAGGDASETPGGSERWEPGPGGEAGRVQREGTSVQSRRGRLSRDTRGAWMFIFDADGEGLADPPVILMPCLLLERLESYMGRLGNDARILISGRVTAYGTKNYMLPTGFSVPNERTKISQ